MKEIKAWMVLKFNKSKTRGAAIWIQWCLLAPHIDLCSLEPYVKATVKNMGVSLHMTNR